jgi:hypothetical protein
MFLWHCPWGCPRRALPGTVFPWSPDFPPSALRRRAVIRPPGTVLDKAYALGEVKRRAKSNKRGKDRDPPRGLGIDGAIA